MRQRKLRSDVNWQGALKQNRRKTSAGCIRQSRDVILSDIFTPPKPNSYKTSQHENSPAFLSDIFHTFLRTEKSFS